MTVYQWGQVILYVALLLSLPGFCVALQARDRLAQRWRERARRGHRKTAGA